MDATSEVRLVLVVEDDRLQALAIRDFLENLGIEVNCAASVDEARRLLQTLHFDVIVLDRMLARTDSLGFIPEARDRFDVPVVVTSAHGSEGDRIAGLDAGADDYLSKPVSLQELHARLRAVHRRRLGPRSPLPPPRRARFGDWLLDVSSHRLTHRTGRLVDLTSGELAVLICLLEHPGRVMTRRDLLVLTHASDGDAFERSVDVSISRLRRKLGSPGDADGLIRTVRASGYQLVAEVAWDRSP